MATRERALTNAVARCYLKRHNGLWFRRAVPVLIRELRAEREAAPVVRDPESWQAVAAAGRKYA